MIPLSEHEREELVAYLNGELDPAAARLVETRLQLDPRVRAEAAALSKTWELLDFLPQAEPSAHFTHRTLERLSAQQTQVASRGVGGRRWSWWAAGLGWAAALLFAAVAGYAGVSYLVAPSPAEDSAEVSRRPAREQIDDLLAHNLSVVQNQRLYENVDDLEYLRSLDQPDLFGEVDVD